VEVYSAGGEYLATGHYHDGSIKVRMYSFSQTDGSRAFWKEKLSSALDLRKKLGLYPNPDCNMFRLVHGEGDGFPGLIVDVYGSCAVLQAHSVGMLRELNKISTALQELFGHKLETIFDKSIESLPEIVTPENQQKYLLGSAPSAIVKEHGVSFRVNWEEGQKTGFFLDQRENRKLLGSYSRGKKVLNAFSYSGGFSMYALTGGAELVHSVDSSKKAAAWARENAKLNSGEDRHEFFEEDVFDYLKKTEQDYDLVILDPPAFAKHLKAADKAMIGYRNLNTEGLRKISAGGILFTFSCSQVIDKILFRKIIFQAAVQAKRNVRVLHQLSQGPDHPVSIYHPEGEYLKGLVLYVD